jgi:hypothetical protein
MTDPDNIQIRPCIEKNGHITSGNHIDDRDAHFFGVYIIVYEDIPVSRHLADFDTRAEVENFAAEIAGGMKKVFCREGRQM